MPRHSKQPGFARGNNNNVSLGVAIAAALLLSATGCSKDSPGTPSDSLTSGQSQDTDMPATDTDPSPVEAGGVDWLRDYDTAIRVAGETEKPVLLLFQEIPG